MKFLIWLCIPFLLTACFLTDRRGVGTVFDDDEIVDKINYDVTHHLTLSQNSHINVNAYNHKVLLTGQVPNAAVKDQLGQFAANTPNVKQVYNEVTIGPPTGLTQRTTDTWITTKISSKFTASNNTGLMRTHVITENGVVYLMGLVTPEEADRATEIARSVAGVKEVVKLFDFVTPP